jgi:hypothetical protein
VTLYTLLVEKQGQLAAHQIFVLDMDLLLAIVIAQVGAYVIGGDAWQKETR